MHRLAKIIVKTVSEVLYVVVAIFVALGFPFLLLSLLPIFGTRWLVANYAKRFKPELGKMLSTRSTIFAVDDLYNKPLCTLIVSLIVHGDLEREEYKEILVRRLMNKVSPTTGELVHAEMTTYLTNWMGFYFWKPQKDFNVDEHLVFPDTSTGPAFTEDDLLLYNTKLIEKPYIKKKSPWEFHVIRNYKPFGRTEDYSMTACVIRVHHSMCDGYSVLELLTSSTNAPFGIARPIPLRKKKSNCRIALDRLSFVLRAPYEFVKTVIESYDRNEWRVPENKLARSMTTGYHPLVPMQRLKEIKTHYGVSFTSVVLEIFSGVVRNYMLLTKVKVPEKLHCLTPLPLPGHPEKLRNFMTCCFTELPLGIPDPIKRLYKIESDLQALKLSTVPFTASIVQQIGGGLFSWMTKIFAVNVIGTAVMTNFPGPDRTVDFFNRQLHELNFGGGLMRGSLSFGMSSISYDGMISLIIGLDKAICPDYEHRKVLVKFITQEIELLESLMKQQELQIMIK